MLGQEQDALGRAFYAGESFIGTLFKFNLWDHVLPDVEVAHLANSCDEDIGNVIAWPDVLRGIHGNVIRENSGFCLGESMGCVTKQRRRHYPHILK